MAFELTQNAINAALENSIELNLVFEIEDVSDVYGVVPIKKFVRIGDPDLEIGDPDINPDAFFIGGFNLLDNQESLVELDGTTTTIRQQLQIDRGKSSGVPNFQVTLTDLDEKITQLITPDTTVSPTFDLLGRRCKIHLGFASTAFPIDYITVFRGAITDIEPGAGNVRFSINSPENKVRKTIFKEAKTTLTAQLTAGATVATVDSTDNFLIPITPPGGGAPTTNWTGYIVVEDEIIKYEAKSASQLQTLTRAQFGTSDVTHASGTEVTALVQMTGNVIDLSLQLLMSGWDGDFVGEISVKNYNIISATETQSNTLFFEETNLVDLHGVVVGDYVSTTGSPNGANNVSEKEITGIVIDGDGNTILTIAGVTFVDETDSPAVMSIRSQYDVFPDGAKLRGDECDIDQFLFYRGTFLPSINYDFRLDEQIDNGKEFLETQLLSPVSGYTIPRDGKVSMGFHSGPIPGQDITTLNDQNVRSPKNIRIRRSTERYFFNEIVYRYDKKNLEDKYLGGRIVVNTDSKNRIENKEKTLTISSDGLRSANSAETIADTAAARRIARYKFGAEFLSVKPLLKTGFSAEIGDIVLFEGKNLQITDIKTGSREFVSRLMEIQQKTLNVKDGSVDIQLVDTNFDGAQRFCLAGPSSLIKSGISDTQFIIEESFGSRFGANEFQKWVKFTNPIIRVRSNDFTTRNATATLINNAGNTFTVDASLGFTPVAGDVIELADFSSLALEITLIYGSISDVAGGDFPDASSTYVLI